MLFTNFLLLGLAAISSSATNVIGGIYNRKKSSPFTYSLFVAIAVLLFFLVTSGFKLEFTVSTFVWAIFFSICYCTTNIMLQISIRLGGVSLTSLVVSYSLVVPTFFSLIAYGEKPLWTFYLGLALLFVSLFFIGYPSKKEKTKISFLWVISVFVTLLTNGGCSLFQSHYQRLSGGKYGNEFMIMSMIMVIIFLLGIVFFEKKEKYVEQKGRAFLGLCAGGFNGLLNYLIIVLVGIMSSSLVFPIFSGISLITTAIAGYVFFKEKLNKQAYLAIIVGVVALVFLNL